MRTRSIKDTIMLCKTEITVEVMLCGTVLTSRRDLFHLWLSTSKHVVA